MKQYLLEQIKSGKLVRGDRVPTEEQLGEMFQVSRMTARRALNDLAREGWIVRRQGIGSFVSEPAIQRNLASLTTLTEELQQMGYTRLNSRVLSWNKLRAPTPIAKIFNISVQAPVLRIERVRYTGDVPIAFQILWFMFEPTWGLTRADLEGGSLYEILERRTGMAVEWAQQRIDAVSAVASHAKWLEVNTGVPLLKVTRRAYFTDGSPLEFAKTYYRSDRYSFQIDLYRKRSLY
nr:GntR family transcriptional regulator [Alicyclobacillus kakegawensis]